MPLDSQSEISEYGYMEKHLDIELIEQIEAFLAASDMRRSTFGKKVANDGSLIAQIEKGRDLRKSTRDKIINFIGRHSKGAPDCSCLSNNADTNGNNAQGMECNTPNTGASA